MDRDHSAAKQIFLQNNRGGETSHPPIPGHSGEGRRLRGQRTRAAAAGSAVGPGARPASATAVGFPQDPQALHYESLIRNPEALAFLNKSRARTAQAPPSRENREDNKSPVRPLSGNGQFCCFLCHLSHKIREGCLKVKPLAGQPPNREIFVFS